MVAVAAATQLGTVRYPQLEGFADADVQRRINEDIVLSGEVSAHLLVLGQLKENGFGLNVSYDSYLCDSLLSVVIRATGQAANGRYMQKNTALCYDLSTGERLSSTRLFADVPAATAALEQTLADTQMDELSAYLENSQLSPLPTDNYFVNADGVTFFYPYDQFSLLSGYAGAAQFSWEELRPWLLADDASVAALAGFDSSAESDLAKLRQIFAEGRMPSVPVALGDAIPDVIARYRLLRDPDYYPGGKLFQLEAPEFRQVTLLSDGMTDGHDHSVVQGVRTRRFDQCGITTGVTAQDEWRRILGEPTATVQYDESTAYDYAVVAGPCDYYPMGEHTLQLFGDANGVLYAVQLVQ